jgi:hypothetical protein
MTDRKKPGVAFWATVVVVGLPLLYVLSFGPVCWITSRMGGHDFASVANAPLVDACLTHGMWKFTGYARWRAPNKWRWAEFRADKEPEKRWHWTDLDLSGY